MEALDKLKDLTDKLPPVPRLSDLVLSTSPSETTYAVEDGESVGTCLLYKEEVAVQDLSLSKGATFPPHTHSTQIEYGIIYEGSLEVTIGDIKSIYTVGDCVLFKKGEVHSAVAITDARILAIAIPRIDGYPKL